MLLIYLLLTLSNTLAASKYDQAIRTATDAAFKQSGYEADFSKVKDASKRIVMKWATDNGLKTTVAAIGFIIPVAYNKKIRFRTGNVVFRGEKNKAEATWTIQF